MNPPRCRAHLNVGTTYRHLVRCERVVGHRGSHANSGPMSYESWNDAVAVFPHESSGRAHDPVNEPEHYKFPGGAEVIHIAQHLSFLAGSAVKYAARAGRKPGSDPLQDLRKARRCIDKEIERLEAARGAQ